MREDWIAIVNCRAGGFRRRETRIVDELKYAVAEIAWTEHAEHAAELAAAFHQYRGIVVVGGDGTLFQAIQGMDRGRQRLAIVPAGRGNSLARDLKVPATLPDLSFAKEPDIIDLMEVVFDTAAGPERRLAASTVAVGYPVAIAQRAGRRFRFLGRQSYVMSAAMTRPAPFYASVLYDDANYSEGRLTGFIVNNTRHIANFLAFPRANCRDGLLDAMQLNRGFLDQTLHNISALTQSFSYQPSLPVSTTKVRLQTTEPRTLLVDGELYLMASRLEVRVITGSLACQKSA